MEDRSEPAVRLIMLQKNPQPPRQEGRKNYQLPQQDSPPSFEQIEEMAQWAQIPTNKGKTVELPFREFVLMAQQVGSKGLEWILYRNDGVTSAREWDIVSEDVNLIYNTLCAQFPDAEVSIKADRLGTTSMHLDGISEEPSKAVAPSGNITSLAKKGKASMTGGLRPAQLPALLQSITLGNMTGNLEIVATNDTAELFFKDGKLYHCAVRGMEGDAAVVELASWESGEYAFYPDLSSEKQSVRNRLENLLMEGMTLVDHLKSLQTSGMTMESFVIRTTPGITEAQFEQIVSQGIPADLNFQKSLYQTVDDKTSMVEILRRFPFPKRYWVPTVFSLTHCKLIAFASAPTQTAPVVVAAQTQPVQPVQVDWQQVRTTERTLTRSDTGIFSYPALLLFLEKEFARNELFNRPFSLLVMDVGIAKGDSQQAQPLNVEGMKALALRIEKLKRKTDLLTHFEMFGLAILLPETSVASARGFLVTLSEALYKSEIVPGIPNESIKLECGVAGIPDDCKSLEILLALAKPKKD